MTQRALYLCTLWCSASLWSGCLAYNEECPAPPSEQVGETQRALDLREHTVRTSEAAAGNLVADALLADTQEADVALVPALVLHRSTECGLRDFIDRGKLTADDVSALLPGEDTVVVLTLTAAKHFQATAVPAFIFREARRPWSPKTLGADPACRARPGSQTIGLFV